jgi:hypothetical protein
LRSSSLESRPSTMRIAAPRYASRRALPRMPLLHRPASIRDAPRPPEISVVGRDGVGRAQYDPRDHCRFRRADFSRRAN